jgi:[pyruvate, water dikinase]-phosphate phosphotransferase / [pyruvate, water dikinase] kinase
VPITIYAVSDYSGETAERVARSATGQFPDNDFNIVMVPAASNKQRLESVIERAKLDQAVIFYTLVRPELREFFSRETGLAGLNALDVLGPALDTLDHVTGKSPVMEPGPITRMDKEYFHWIDAIQFTVKHDDGAEPEDMINADIVLVGVSRTGKTPLSIYLAYRGWKVANVPIVYGLPYPKELFSLKPENIIGLAINPRKLHEIRERRLTMMASMAGSQYADPTHILKEIRYSQELMRRLKCRVIDVTGKAVEETAQEIITGLADLEEPLV